LRISWAAPSKTSLAELAETGFNGLMRLEDLRIECENFSG
jgi:hypothetical protein